MFLRKLVKKGLKFCGSLYHRLMATRFVWRHIRNKRARRLYRERSTTLKPAEAAVLATLRRQGIAIARISDFFPAGVFEELKQFVERRWQEPDVKERFAKRDDVLVGGRPKDKSYFLINLWDGPAVLDLTHPFLRFSLAEPILRVVNAYLNMFAKFRGWRLETTVPMPEHINASSSQRWHRDEEDSRTLVKTFLYLNDVDDETGPFMYLKYSHPGGRHRGLFPARPPRGTPPMPENEGRFIPQEDIQVCTGRAGALVFCDTSGLHKGGFAKTRERFMYTSVYTTSASPWPIRYRYPEGFSA